MDDRPSFIYALHDPTEVSLRCYVGKSMEPGERYSAHLTKAKKGQRLSANWVRSLTSRGVRPAMVILEEVPPGGDWREAEQFWIASFRSMGIPLANLSDGGEGKNGYLIPDENRARPYPVGKTGYRGVGKVGDTYQASIHAGGRDRHLGTYATPIEAAVAYDIEARGRWGCRALVNFPSEGERAARFEVEPGSTWDLPRPRRIDLQRSPTTRARMAARKHELPCKSKTGFKGVVVANPGRSRSIRYSAKIKIANASRCLGTYATAEEAARAYDDAARAAWGAEASLNFPLPGERHARRSCSTAA